MEKEFKLETSLLNSHLINEHTWQLVVAKATEPDNPKNFKRNSPAIKAIIESGQAYYETWKLVKEKEGYIFREINHGGGISGPHATAKKAIKSALQFWYIKITIELP